MRPDEDQEEAQQRYIINNKISQTLTPPVCAVEATERDERQFNTGTKAKCNV